MAAHVVSSPIFRLVTDVNAAAEAGNSVDISVQADGTIQLGGVDAATATDIAELQGQVNLLAGVDVGDDANDTLTEVLNQLDADLNTFAEVSQRASRIGTADISAIGADLSAAVLALKTSIDNIQAGQVDLSTTSIDALQDVVVANIDENHVLKWDPTARNGDGAFVNSAVVGEQGPAGADGDSAYEVAVANGFVGNEAAWLASLVGAEGADGADGAAGAPGADGADGAAGADGDSAYEVAVANGFVGNEAAWLASLVGADGADGAQGDVGPAGPEGPAGPQGPAGADGAQGAVGPGIVFQGSVATEADLPANGNAQGDAYLVQADDSLHIFDGNSFVDGGSIQGPQGIQGAEGPAGPQGQIGAQGPAGADGDSAYDVAVANGFVGNEAAWLASLVGADGADGADGAAGADGADADNNAIANLLAADEDFQDAVASSSASAIGAPPAPDNSYADGLFSDWTANTTIGTAMDSINEVLKGLAPSPAPRLTDADIGASTTGTTALLSIGADTNINGDVYYAVDSDNLDPASSLADVGKGSSFSVTTSGGHRRLGVLNGSTDVSGRINDSVAADGSNYPNDAFGYADQGTLKLYVNDNANPVNTADLTSSANAIDSRNAGTGFNLSASDSGAFSNGDEFALFKHRTGTYHVAAASQREGWNFARVVHTIGAVDYTSEYVEWFVDADANALSVSSSSLNNLSMAGSSFLSGVEYHTSGGAQYSISVANAYRNTHSAGSVTFNTTNVSVASQAIPAIGADDYTKALTLSNIAATINSTSILDGALSVSANVPHPVKSDLTAAGGQSISGILLYSLADNSTVLNETFRGEDYRLDSGAYANQAAVTGASWNSQSSIAGSADLLVHDQKLMYPTQGANSGNFSTIANGPAGNVDYSSEAGDKEYYRKFQNNSNSSKTTFTLSINGSGSTIVPSGGSLSATNIKVFVKLPSTSNSQSTGWMDIASAFTTGNTGDNDGAFSGSFNNTPSGTNSNTITFGSVFAAHNDYIMIKVVAGQSWTGYLSNIEVDWS
jgi:hypothetical protein